VLVGEILPRSTAVVGYELAAKFSGHRTANNAGQRPSQALVTSSCRMRLIGTT